MTERLYYRDAGLLAFDATVVAHADDPRRAILDRTAFYPTSGGQPHDTGMLGGARVLDVIDEGDRIIHVLDAGIALGPAHGEIDPARRRDHMEQHTAQHLVSAIAADQFGWQTESVHFGAEHSTIEFGTATVTDAQLEQLEARVNAAIREALPVRVTFEDAAAATTAGLRKAPGRSGEIRVITIAGVDRSACGGTHTASTAEIGIVMLRGVERLRGRVRVGFLAGERVLAHLRSRDQLLGGLAASLSCAVEELGELVPKRQEELKLVRKYRDELEQELAGVRMERLAALTAPDAKGIKWILHRATTEPTTFLRAMAQAAGGMAHVVFVAVVPSPPSVIVSASADSGVDAGALLKASLASAGGKGGGSPRMAQGTVADSERLEALVACLRT